MMNTARAYTKKRPAPPLLALAIMGRKREISSTKNFMYYANRLQPQLARTVLASGHCNFRKAKPSATANSGPIVSKTLPKNAGAPTFEKG